MIIDGKAIAGKKLEDLRSKIIKLGIKPKLAIVMVKGDPATEIYVRLKRKAAAKVGIETEIVDSLEKVSPDTDGIIVQLPYPNQDEVIAKIPIEKDVDGLTGKSDFLPATVKGILTALEGFEIEGKDVTIIGRSQEVGKPLAMALIDLGATVTVCHSKTQNLKLKTQTADILISATGHPGLVTVDMVKQGAVVIDVGTPKGDVDFENVKNIASAITPVPGGIGPLTVVSLLENTLEASRIINDKL